MKKIKDSTFTLFLFSAYVILLVWIILFKLGFSFSILDHMRNINLIPFYYATTVSKGVHIREIAENVLIFIPFGLYLKMININSKKVILSALLTSIFFETAQYVFSIGATDITDVITNTTGAIVGLCIYNILSITFDDKKSLNKAINITALMCTCLIALILSGMLVLSY